MVRGLLKDMRVQGVGVGVSMWAGPGRGPAAAGTRLALQRPLPMGGETLSSDLWPLHRLQPPAQMWKLRLEKGHTLAAAGAGAQVRLPLPSQDPLCGQAAQMHTTLSWTGFPITTT